jgi:hypothetical protein
MVTLIIVLIINDFKVHTVGQKTQALRWAWDFRVYEREDLARRKLTLLAGLWK